MTTRICQAGFTVFAVLLIIAAAWRIPNLQMDSDIMALFPKALSEDPEVSKIKSSALKKVNSQVSNKLFILIGEQSFDKAKNAAFEFKKHLDVYSVFSRIDLELNPEAFLELEALYQQHSALLLSESTQESLTHSPSKVIQKRIRQLFTSPGQIGATHFEQDPLNFSNQFLQSNMDRINNKLSIEEDVLTVKSNEKHFVALQLYVKDSVFSLADQTAITNALNNVKSETLNIFPNATFVESGPFYFARSGADQAKNEISTVGLGSLIGIVILLIVVFRSSKVLLFSLFPTAIGVLTGLVISSLLFEKIHMVALVFGASLIGVSIDYSFHFLTSRLASQSTWNPNDGLKKLLPGLTLGLVTSSIAYLSFSISGFPGFEQIAFFSAAGLLGAYLTVIGAFPFIFSRPSRSPAAKRFQLWLNRYITQIQTIKNRPEKLVIFSLAIVSAGLLGIVNLTAQDDIRTMQSASPEVIQATQKFQALTGQQTATQFFVVGAKSAESMLQKMENISEQLSNQKQDHLAISHWIPSRKKQQENHALIQDKLIKTQALEQFLTTLNVKSESAQTINQHYSESTVSAPLLFSDTIQTVQNNVDLPWYFNLDDQLYGIVVLGKITTPLAELAKFEQHANQIYWVDPVSDTSSLLKLYRQQSTNLLLFAYLAAFILLGIRYRSTKVLLVIAPPAFASFITCLLMLLLGEEINVFNIMAFLLILGIGVDYTIFLSEAKSEHSETLFAVVLSTLTTILSFGLLSLSQTQAISSFGVTVLIGIIACFILSPLAITENHNNNHH